MSYHRRSTQKKFFLLLIRCLVTRIRLWQLSVCLFVCFFFVDIWTLCIVWLLAGVHIMSTIRRVFISEQLHINEENAPEDEEEDTNLSALAELHTQTLTDR